MTTDNLLFKLNTIAAVSGKKDKQAIVATYTEAEREIIKRALDPTVSYYIAAGTFPTPTTTGTDEWGPAEYNLLDNLASRKLTGHEALREVGFSLRELSHSSGELLRRVILKDLRCGAGVSLTNAAFPGLIPDFAYMRCTLPKDSNIEKWDWSKGVYSQLKANGMFARIDHDNDGNVLITSRQGNTFPPEALKSLTNDARWAFLPGTQTHGELTVYRSGELLQRSVGNGILNSLQLEGEFPADCEIRFDAWDQIPLVEARPKGKFPKPYGERLTNLELQLMEAGATRISAIEYRVVHSKAEAMAHYREILARKLEGTVCKTSDAIWLDGDNKDQVKFKLEVDVDLQIVGFRPGEVGKRTEHTFGSVLCQTIDGQLEVAVSGFKRDMEQYLHDNRDSVLGKVMCVRANEVAQPSDSNELHSLYHPRFVELRSDKYEADTLQAVLDQFEAAIA